MTCKTCGGYSIATALYVGGWRWHPDNPINPKNLENPDWQPRVVAKCPVCFPKKEKQEND